MGDQLYVDTTKMATALPGVDALSQALGRIHTELVNQLNALGPCWSDDTTGKVFASQYIPSVEKEFGAFNDTTNGLTNMRDGVDTMITGFHNTEMANQETARRLALQAAPQPPGGPGNTNNLIMTPPGANPGGNQSAPTTARQPMVRRVGGTLTPRIPTVPTVKDNTVLSTQTPTGDPAAAETARQPMLPLGGTPLTAETAAVPAVKGKAVLRTGTPTADPAAPETARRPMLPLGGTPATPGIPAVAVEGVPAGDVLTDKVPADKDDAVVDADRPKPHPQPHPQPRPEPQLTVRHPAVPLVRESARRAAVPKD